MNTFSTIHDIGQTILVTGDTVRILGERIEGDSATMTGRVRADGETIYNRVVYSKNNLPVEIFPQPAVGVSSSFVEGEIHDFHTNTVKESWKANYRISSWVHKIYQEGEYYIPRTIPFITLDTWLADKGNWVIIDSDQNTLRKIVGDATVTLREGEVITPDGDVYPKLLAFDTIYELQNNSDTYTVKSFTKLEDGNCQLTLQNNTLVVAHKFASLSTEHLIDKNAHTADNIKMLDGVSVETMINTELMGRVDAQVVIATEAATRSENSADAAAASAKIYKTVAEGIAATTNGELFLVVSDKASGFSDLYLNDGGAGVYQDKTTVDAMGIEEKLLKDCHASAFSITDSYGRSALAIMDDGTTRIKKLDAESSSSVDMTASTVNTQLLNVQGTHIQSDNGFSIVDTAGQVALSLDMTGALHVVSLIAGNIKFKNMNLSSVNTKEVVINNVTLTAKDNDFVALNKNGIPLLEVVNGHLLTKPIKTYRFILNAGQSLAEGFNRTPDLTRKAEYGSLGFPWDNANANKTLLPLDLANTASHNRVGMNESPMYGAVGFINEKRRGFMEGDTFVAKNVGYSGANITQLSKGGITGKYETGMDALQKTVDFGLDNGHATKFEAVVWTQGEANSGDVNYAEKLTKLVNDYNTEGKKITGQVSDFQFISYQLCKNLVTFDTVSKAQLQVADAMLNVHVATPTYMLDFYDGTHLNARASKVLGAYYGLVYNTVVIDKKEWQPLRPKSVQNINGRIEVKFNKTGLVFDSSDPTIMPLQPNYGFSVYGADGAELSITSVELINDDVITISSSHLNEIRTVKYGYNQVIGKEHFTSCGGNLRDSQGDKIIYHGIMDQLGEPWKMHNWCVLFEEGVR